MEFIAFRWSECKLDFYKVIDEKVQSFCCDVLCQSSLLKVIPAHCTVFYKIVQICLQSWTSFKLLRKIVSFRKPPI